MTQRCKEAERIEPARAGEAGGGGISRRGLFRAGLAGGLLAAAAGGCASSEEMEQVKSE